MAEDHTVKIVYQSAVVSVGDIRCAGNRSEWSGEKWSSSCKIVFPRSGLFINKIRGKEVVVDPNHIIFFNRNEEYRTSHPVPGGDECTGFVLNPQVLSEIRSQYDPKTIENLDLRFPFTSTPSNSGIYLAHRILLGYISSRDRLDLISVDENALQLLSNAIDSAYNTVNTKQRKRKISTERSHSELSDKAKVVLAAKYREPLSLDQIARCVNSSPYHLCRVFKRSTGLSIHQYLNRLRLRSALECVCESDLSKLAFEVGYSSHSHFSDAFRREFGISPSGFRNIATGKTIRKLSKNLTA
ncbi:MAG TPA: AraC family transcriptional regulator [Blastocatellia bacterium]|nr:AraC family transcriptional regulator [Blastocatellia bacterium]